MLDESGCNAYSNDILAKQEYLMNTPKYTKLSKLGFSHHLLLPLFAILLVGGIGLYLTFGSKAATTTLQARRASDFLESIGVCAHLVRENYPAKEIVGDKLSYLGVKYVRSDMGVSDSKGAEMAQYLGGRGIKFDFIIAPPKLTNPTVEDIKRAVDTRLSSIVDNGLTPYVFSVEPFNEYNNSTDPGWAATIKQAMPYIYSQRSRLDPKTLILGPSLINFKLKTDAEQLQFAADGSKLSTHFNRGNLHTYYGADKPESTRPDSVPLKLNLKPETRPTGASGTFDERLSYYAYFVSPDKPIIVTETGYSNDSVWDKRISEKASGTYTSRMLLESFRIGIAKTFVYEMYNEPQAEPSYEKNYGIFKVDGTPKPAARAIHSLTSLLQGADAKVKSASLPVTLSDTGTGLKKVLLQKNSKEYWLALWRDTSVYTSHKDTPVSPRDLSLTFSGKKTITAYTGLQQTSPSMSALGSKSTVKVPVGADVTLLKIQL